MVRRRGACKPRRVVEESGGGGGTVDEERAGVVPVTAAEEAGIGESEGMEVDDVFNGAALLSIGPSTGEQNVLEDGDDEMGEEDAAADASSGCCALLLGDGCWTSDCTPPIVRGRDCMCDRWPC